MGMIESLLQNLDQAVDPQKVQALFYYSQMGVGVLFILGIVWIRSRRPDSGFHSYGSDSKPDGRFRSTSRLRIVRAQDDAEAGSRKTPQVLRLAGFSFEGKPHEILGISPEASERDIQGAYRELMKRFHPDKVGRPGSREWTDAQQIAEAINRARAEMLALRSAGTRYSHKPKRSGL